MYLYHVTPVVDMPERMKFIPRIPKSAGKTEDHTIPRVCMSDSIKLAIQASPDMMYERRSGMQFRVYKFRVDRRSKLRFIEPMTLFKNGLVPDAIENHEYWCLDDITMSSKIYEIEKVSIDFDLAWSVISAEQIIKITKHILGDKLKDIKISRNYKDSKDLYNMIAHQLDELHYYNECDDLWEGLAELPWATIRRIDELKIKEV